MTVPAKKDWRDDWPRLLVIGAFVIVAIAALSRPSTPRSQPVAPEPVAPRAWSPPSGFSLSDDPNVAWKWDTDPDCSDYAEACWGMYLLAHIGCPHSLYVELTMMDAAGNAIGYTNDTGGAVAAGQQARLTFESPEEAAKKARLAEVSCY